MAKEAVPPRVEALAAAMDQVDKKYGDGTVMRLGERPSFDGNVIGTGSLAIDIALGVGGVPRGRIIEIFGAEASGKTTLAMHIMAEAQRAGGTAAIIDAEHALDPSYAKQLGINTDDLLISQPSSGEQALDIVDVLVRSLAVDVIVVDSVAALTPKAELDGEMGDQFVGLQARMMSQAMRKLTGSISRSNCCVIFINQTREKIGVMYGSPETTPGGKALKFYCSVRLKARRTGSVKDGTEVIGSEHVVQVVKNKVAPPFREAAIEIIYGKGISRHGEILAMATDLKLIKKSGSWFSLGETRLGQGRENARTFLEENPRIAVELENAVRTAHNMPLLPVPTDDPAEG